MGPATAGEVAAKFNPSEPRIPGGEHGGEWGSGGGIGHDLLKLADRISLGDGEKLERSDKVNLSDATAVMAWTSGPGGQHLRFGIVDKGDAGKWRGANKGGTAVLDEHATAALSQSLEKLAQAGADGNAEAKAFDKAAGKLSDRLPGEPKGKAEHAAWLAKLSPADRQAVQDMGDEYDALYDQPWKRDAIHADWGTIRFEVWLSEGSTSRGAWEVKVAVVPKPDDTGELPDTAATMTPGNLRKIQAALVGPG